ncbi:MAG: hypothetical protein GXW85_11845 [Clostridia bacterium]|nr:hypothetical protein [Clostridia bacterium]
MRKVSDFHNLPVINITSGNQLGKVEDVILDAEHDILHGFVCEGKLLPLKQVKTLGKDALMVEAEDLEPLMEAVNTNINPPLFLPKHVLATPIVTDKGECIGTVGDILVEEETGKIIGYEVSDGLLKDLVTGRKVVSVPQIIAYGEDAIVIKE